MKSNRQIYLLIILILLTSGFFWALKKKLIEPIGLLPSPTFSPAEEGKVLNKIQYSKLEEIFDSAFKAQVLQKTLTFGEEILPNEYKVFSIIPQRECPSFNKNLLLFPARIRFLKGNLYVSISTKECSQGEIEKVIGYIFFNNNLVEEINFELLIDQFPEKKWLSIWNPLKINSLGAYSIAIEARNSKNEILDRIEAGFEIIREQAQ